MSAIEVRDLKKYFGKTKAVDGVSFSVEKGEIFGFLGPNGAGKTTTIKCLMDFVRPSSGNINILGLNAQTDSVELKSKIGFLSDTAHFYDHWSAQKHLLFQESLRGKSKILSELLQKFDLNQKLQFGNLSSGNRRKLGIILALMNEPEILILDEPTSALDPILQVAFHNYLKEFSEKGGTVFMSSHNLSEVEKICDRVGIIKDGKMVALEKISEMKLKKMYDISFHTSETQLNIEENENIKIISRVDGLVMLKIKGDINSLISQLAKIEIKDLEITHAGLEDIFMEFYVAKRSPSEVLTKEDK